jgi:hypothetical protein
VASLERKKLEPTLTRNEKEIMTRIKAILTVYLLLICCVLPLLAQSAVSADSVVPGMELPGFDQEAFARYSVANRREVTDMLDEFTLVRQSTIAFFNSLDDAALMRTGVADANRASVRTLAYHIAGHELRHMNVIKERYLR